MSQTITVYLNLQEIMEVRNQEVYLKDVATVHCSDQTVLNKCNALKVKTISEKKNKRYMESALDVIKKLESLQPNIQVNNVGKVEYIIDYIPPEKPNVVWQWLKTVVVCIVCFCGAAFAIMTFNNDVDVISIFDEVYRLITGTESDGFTILELSYSIGLALGILIFFNHFASWKMNTDPTPLEVEMRLYEDNISKTLIQNDGRKERQIDVS